MHDWLRLTIRQRDEEATRIAEMNGTPPPTIILPPVVTNFKELGEHEFGVEVLARGHRFMSAHEAFTSDDEPVVALHMSNSDTDADLIRRLAHEFGHRRQKKNQDVFDRRQVEGYVACERSAENYGWADAVAWGYGEYFPPDFQKEVEDSLNDFESALYDLEASLEIHDAFALVAIGLQIMWLESPQVAHLLKPIVGDRSYLNGWKELEQILWSHPEFLSGFDRFCLGSSWSVTRYGESVSLPLDNPEEAASGLYMLMQDSAIYSRRAPAACRKLLEDPDDKTQRYLACLEGYSGACRFVGFLQDLLIMFSSYPVALDFWHAELGDLAIIKASLKWNLGNDDSVEWSLYWYASGSELASPRGNNILMGLWYFVNSFQSRCGIYPKHGSELWRDLVWQLGRDSTAVDLSKYKLVGNSS